MISRQELEGQWTEVKGRVQQRWGDLTDNDLQRVRGDANQLVGVIQQRTGESRHEIESFLEEIVCEGASVADRAARTAREYGDQVGDAMAEGYEAVAANVRHGYEQAHEAVRRNPLESVAVAFGAGLITGVVVGLILRNR